MQAGTGSQIASQAYLETLSSASVEGKKKHLTWSFKTVNWPAEPFVDLLKLLQQLNAITVCLPYLILEMMKINWTSKYYFQWCPW